ncbi:NAD(P)-dependent alcohol dehydrogenase [Phyllobacterium sp. SB3]|uniref:zinc-dependent alcohol dehydrogenase family protein n=1 Tax=Phyllobacterium sp. SB3 TaxID=3156073 RepID=UPI0032AF89FB
MKRWQVAAPGRDNLKLVEVATPALGQGQILVKVAAISLNYRDGLLIDTGFGMPDPLEEPLVPASDFSGTVVAVGDGVTRFAEGDRVISTFVPDWIDGAGPGTARTPNSRTLGGPLQGGLAEYVAISEDWAVRAPSRLSDIEASTLPCAGLTAWTALVERGNVRAGDKVVILGTGGVSLFGLQIALAHGAEVIVVSGDDDKLLRARKIGAHHTINRKKEDWVEALYKITDDYGADHILETVGGPHLDKSLRAAAVTGRISMIGILDGLEVTGGFVPLAVKRLVLEGIQVGNRKGLENFVKACDQIEIKPIIDGVYPFDELNAALDHLGRGPFGKIVVELN